MHAADLLSKRAELTPEREAAFDLSSGERYTFAGLNRRANRLAHLMRRLGVGPGDRVSLLAYNSVIYLDLLYGLPKIGAIFTPLNWRLSARELSEIVDDCRPKVLLAGPEFVQTAAEVTAAVPVPVCLGVEGAEAEGWLSYEQELDLSPEGEPERPALTGEDPYCILYTSGTTGRPKGAVLPHRQILWNCINTVISWGLREDEVTPIFTPMFHSGGLFAMLTPVLYAGGRAVIARGFDPEASLRTIVDERCTVILGVPTIYRMWMKSPYFQEADFSHVHFFISGGAPCPASLIHEWQAAKNVPLRQGYGLTEVGTNCFTMTDEQSLPKAGSVGKPIFHSWMRLVDAQGRDMPPGETGELLIAGPHVCLGYWNNPEATQAAFLHQPGFPWPWFRTGDMARQDEDGDYTIAGRFKDMIISGGENIYAAEVETVFREHPAVADAALIGVPDETWGEIGLMAVVLKPGQSASEEELLDFCRRRLARYKAPKRVVFKTELPYSPYGKVMKAELRKEFVPDG